MPQPDRNAVHVNGPLTNISVAYMQDQSAYVSTKAFPVIPVQKQSDLYFTYNKNDFFRDQAQRRAPGTESAGGGYNVDATASYSCRVEAFHKDVDPQVRANSDNPLNADQDAVRFVTQVLMIRQEVQWANDFFRTGIWGTSTTPAKLWSDYSASDPITDVETAITTILTNTGKKANKMILGYPVFIKLKHHPDIIDRIKYTAGMGDPAQATPQTLAKLFGIGEILVCEAVYATNNEGETAAMNFVQGKHALVCYAPASPSLMEPSAGYTFQWTGISRGLGTATAIYSIPMDFLGVGTLRQEGEIAYAQKLVSADCGYFLESVVS
jgi:hypothetical protein